MSTPENNSFKVVSKYIMDTAPLLMRKMRTHVMQVAVGELTLTQYRILANIYRGVNSVTEIAEHQGVTQPSMSKMINIMIERKLVSGEKHPEDKRQTILKLTKSGEDLFLDIRQKAQNRIAGHLKNLETEDIETLEKALSQIQKVLKKWN